MSRIFIIILILSGTIAGGIFYLAPEWDRFNALRQNIAHLHDVNREFDDIIQSRDALIELINTISKEDLDRLSQALPEGPHSPELLVLFENFAREHAATLKILDIKQEKKVSSERKDAFRQPTPVGVASETLQQPGTITELPVSLTLSYNSYESLKGFLKNLENNLRFIDIATLQFATPDENQKGKEAGGESEATVSIKAKTYYQ